MEAFGISFSDAECDEHAVKLRAAFAQLDDIYLASDLGPSLKQLWKTQVSRIDMVDFESIGLMIMQLTTWRLLMGCKV